MREFDAKGLDLATQQAELFVKSLKMFNGSSNYFVKAYMNSDIVKKVDRYGYFDSTFIFYTLYHAFPSLDKGDVRYSEDIMYWCGYLYRYWAYTYKISSKSIYKIMPITELARLYEPYHTMDPSVAISRIYESKNLEPQKDELLILKRIYGLL